MIYLDNNATTKIDDRVLEAMMPFLTSAYGNSASNHRFGVEISKHVNEAREKVASLINCEPSEIIFTSGATEAINLAIKGVAAEFAKKGNHIITIATEHPAVLDTCKYLQSTGTEVTYLPVKSDGIIDLDLLRREIRPSTVLIEAMLVNNETGVIQPIERIAAMAHELGIFFMTDASQAVGKMPVDVQASEIDLLSLSSHKFYGPKGIGALYIRNKRPFKVKIATNMHGGGHERGLRSGTMNVPGIVGMGSAAEIASREMSKDSERVGKLRDELETSLMNVENAKLNGNCVNRIYNTTNVRFEGVDADAIIAGLEDVMVSNGSACSSIKVEPSHVLRAMGLSEEECFSSVRLSLGRFSQPEDVEIASRNLKSLIESLRKMSGWR